MRPIETLHGAGDYRSFLLDLLEERRRRNDRYSFRAFARDLRLSPTFLHGVLHGTRSFSYEMTIKVGLLLDFDPYTIEYFYALVQLGESHAEMEREMLMFRCRLIYDAALRTGD